jgi:hypothetical protein
MHRVQGNVSFFYVGRGNNNMTFFGRNTTTWKIQGEIRSFERRFF